MIEKHPKSKYRAVLTALAADCRAFPGFGGESKGLTAVAESLGCNRNTLQSQINPDNRDIPMPSLAKLLDIMSMTGGEHTSTALAGLVGKRVVDFDLPGPVGSSADCVQEFHKLLSAVGPLLTEGCARAQDGVFCRSDRSMLEPMLISLIQQANALLNAFAQDAEEGR